VIVRGDKAVAVVDLHPVAAAPRVPSCGTYHSGIRGVHFGFTGGRVVLAEMEVSCGPGERAYAETEGRAGVKLLEGCHQESSRRPAEPGRVHYQGPFPVVASNHRVGERDQRPRICEDRPLQQARTNDARSLQVAAGVAGHRRPGARPRGCGPGGVIGPGGGEGLPVTRVPGKIQGPD
jgi:hypothetical protein